MIPGGKDEAVEATCWGHLGICSQQWTDKETAVFCLPRTEFQPRLEVLSALFLSALQQIVSNPAYPFNATWTSDKTSLVKKKKILSEDSTFYTLWTRNIERDLYRFPWQRQMHVNYVVLQYRQRVEKRETMVNRDFKWGGRETGKNGRTTLSIASFLKVWKTSMKVSFSSKSLQQVAQLT